MWGNKHRILWYFPTLPIVFSLLIRSRLRTVVIGSCTIIWESESEELLITTPMLSKSQYCVSPCRVQPMDHQRRTYNRMNKTYPRERHSTQRIVSDLTSDRNNYSFSHKTRCDKHCCFYNMAGF